MSYLDRMPASRSVLFQHRTESEVTEVLGSSSARVTRGEDGRQVVVYTLDAVWVRTGVIPPRTRSFTPVKPDDWNEVEVPLKHLTPLVAFLQVVAAEVEQDVLDLGELLGGGS